MRIFVFLFALLLCTTVVAQKSKIRQLEQQRKEALREISNTNRLLSETKKTTTTLLDRIQLIANQIFSRQRVLKLLEQEISGIEAEQKQIEEEVSFLEVDLKAKQQNYAKAVEAMLNNRQNENRLLFILSGKSLTESYRRLRYLRDYSEWRSRQAEEIKEKSSKLKERKEALAKAKTEKTALLNLRIAEQAKLKEEEDIYKKEVAEVKRKQGDLQKILTQKRKQADALDRQIEKLIAEEVSRQEREAERLAKESKKTDAGKTGDTKESAPAKKLTTPENMALSNNFVLNKGKLPYPISGNSTIITRFGRHKHSDYVTTNSSGLDIRSGVGADAKAVFKGEVTYVAAIPGYNTCIIVRHGNYYTFYGNIQNISVKQGDRVDTGQVLGKAYADSDTGFSQIHFQLWQKTTKLNPEPWLRR